MKKIALSGIQTSGKLHLGNYLGSIKNWQKLQNHYECYFFLANLHAITVDQDPGKLKNSTFEVAATYLACGLDPKKCHFFAQSSLHEHSEFAWLLNCITPIGWLKRMTQFKDKAGKNQDSASTGLFTYPLLMASDILLYKPDIVPVGADQKQHLELTRDIAGIINKKFGKELFPLPEALIENNCMRVMSLRDGRKKMSKSDPSDAAKINLSDTNEEIAKKIAKSKTDSFDYLSYDLENRPEISNLLEIYSNISTKNITEIIKIYENCKFSVFKQDLADIIIDHLRPIREKFESAMQNKLYLSEILASGAEKARERASFSCKQLKDEFGLI